MCLCCDKLTPRQCNLVRFHLNLQDNLKDILNEATHCTEQHSKTDTSNSNVLRPPWSTESETTAEVAQSLEESLGRPQNKRARVLMDMNHQPKTAAGK